MIARKLKCQICGKQYLAKWDDAIMAFAPHCTLDIFEFKHYVKNVELYTPEQAEAFRDSVADFVADIEKLLNKFNDVDDTRIEEIFNDFSVRI